MNNKRIYQPGRKIKPIYQDEGGDLQDPTRIGDDGTWHDAVRNGETQTVVPIRDLAEDRQDQIAEALRRFVPIGRASSTNRQCDFDPPQPRGL